MAATTIRVRAVLIVPAGGTDIVELAGAPHHVGRAQNSGADTDFLRSVRAALDCATIAGFPLTTRWYAWCDPTTNSRHPVNARATWLARSFGEPAPKQKLRAAVVIVGTDPVQRDVVDLRDSQIDAIWHRVHEVSGPSR